MRGGGDETDVGCRSKRGRRANGHFGIGIKREMEERAAMGVNRELWRRERWGLSEKGQVKRV